MPLVKVQGTGQAGVNKDLSSHELPPNAWTDALNVRFLDGNAMQYFGHREVYATPSQTPQHIFPVSLASQPYWIYATAAKQFAVTTSGGTVTHTDISHATARTGVVNKWTSTLLSGVPILNAGDGKAPMYWDGNLANKFVDLTNWPANTSCKSLRAYKNFLIALNVTKSTINYPFMVKWSHPADPGTLPSSWNEADATKDAGESDLAEGQDEIIDGLQLRDSFMIYKKSSVWRMDYTGGPFVFRFQKVLGISGVLNPNCIVEVDGFHVVLTQSDVVVHDGQTATSVLDKQTRRDFFQKIDSDGLDKCFVFKNPFFNEVLIAYPSLGSTVCDRAMVWNYVDRTVTFRELPNVNHANYGFVSEDAATTWSDPEGWASDLSLWGSGGIVPSNSRSILASSNGKIYMMDSATTFDGVTPSAYIERRGLSFGAPEQIKLVRGVRPRIKGNNGDVIKVKVGYSDDPYADPTYTEMTHTVGTTLKNDCLVTGRYIAIRFEASTAYLWRLDSYDIDVETVGMY